MRQEIDRNNKGHFNLIDHESGFKIDMYPFTDDPLEEWGLSHCKQVELLPEETVWVAPPEYVIIKELIYYQEGESQKHLN